MKVRVIAAVMAVVLALVGAVLVSGYVRAADARALEGLENKEVYVVDTAVPAETPVEDLGKHLRKQALPLTAVAEDAVVDLEEFEGRVTAVALQPDEQLLGGRLVTLNSLQEPGRVALPKGLQEVTVQLSPDRVVGGQLEAGEFVGIFASFEEGPGDKPATELVFHRVLVTSVQGAPAAAEAGGDEPTADTPPVPEGALLVTLAQDAAAAEKTVFAAEFGTLWLAKQPVEAKWNDTGASMEDFFK
ncbi:Flp pilus assembly protein CpaB [Kocuria sp. M4R2S49]|uniref:Flp pilus assembly protein CpaB n=1 Tax=Kocuria rhizosphaericola TaxID=3376284 RepID=UPI0037B1C242